MAKDFKKDKGKKCNALALFMTLTAITTAVVMVTVLEGRRIKKENELLSYEVW